MSATIPPEIIADVRDRTDIVEVVGHYVQLKRSGASFKGLCPFHQEKTPSFNVNAERQFYHCFGCQESGDVFAFLMKVEGRGFIDILEDLADRAGVVIERSEGQREALRDARTKRERGLRLNDRVARLYQNLLAADAGAPARQYVAERGIGPEVSEAFRLGYAPDSAQLVTRLLRKHGIAWDFAADLGLISRRRSGSGFADRFRNRVVFPLLGVRGEVLGFGGRALSSEQQPKYLNTPETALYHKGEALYGLNLAAPAMRRSRCGIVVEGNFDVLQMHQAGFANTVAPMGTALTDSQAQTVARFASKVIVLFDGDPAGGQATQRAVCKLLGLDVDAHVARVPASQDPDTVLKEGGRQALLPILERAIPGLDYLLEAWLAEAERSIHGRASVVERVVPLIAQQKSEVAKDLYVDRVAMVVGVERAVVERALRRRQHSETRDRHRARVDKPDMGDQRQDVVRLDPRELDALAILVEHPHLFPRAEQADVLSLLTNGPLRATYSAAIQIQRESGQVRALELLSRTPASVHEQVAALLLSEKYGSIGDPTRALDDCVASLRRLRVDEELKAVRTELHRAQAHRDGAELSRLRERLVALVERKREIHQVRSG